MLERITASQARRDFLSRIQESDILNRLQAADLCRSNPYAPAWTSLVHPTGRRMEVVLSDEISRQLYLFGAYEESLSRFLVSTLKTGHVFVDAGAHYGYFTLLASSLVGDAGRVIAFEAHPETAARLTRNVAGCANVRVEAKALWTEAGSVGFNAAEAQFSAYSSAFGLRLPEETAPPRLNRLDVPAVSLDGYCAEHDLRPDVIKIDVESSEMQVLQGAASTLQHHRPILSIEVGDHDQLVAEGVASSNVLLDKVQSYGYDLFDIMPSGLELHQRLDHYKYDNIVALPR